MPNLPLRFPLRGLTELFPYSSPGPEYTFDCLNVVPHDTQQGRARGGKRPGTSRVIAEQVDQSDTPVQRMKQVTLASGTPIAGFDWDDPVYDAGSGSGGEGVGGGWLRPSPPYYTGGDWPIADPESPEDSVWSGGFEEPFTYPSETELSSGSGGVWSQVDAGSGTSPLSVFNGAVRVPRTQDRLYRYTHPFPSVTTSRPYRLQIDLPFLYADTGASTTGMSFYTGYRPDSGGFLAVRLGVVVNLPAGTVDYSYMRQSSPGGTVSPHSVSLPRINGPYTILKESDGQVARHYVNNQLVAQTYDLWSASPATVFPCELDMQMLVGMNDSTASWPEYPIQLTRVRFSQD